MEMNWKRPQTAEVTIKDRFWTPYLEKIRRVMLPYVLDRLEGDGYAENFAAAASGPANGRKHRGPPFSDGLFWETLRGACDFLAQKPDAELEARIDRYIALFSAASAVNGGFLCTRTILEYPDRRWGENGGNIIHQHDLYDHGALIEAAVSHYLATGKTTLLTLAVRAADLICSEIGEPPKRNIVPGHSLPEEAFVRLYRLFRDHRELDALAEQENVRYDAYLSMAVFWYEARGRRENRTISVGFSAEYNQDHETFSLQRTAVGHSVRASLCYTGAAAVTYETRNAAYREALDALWDNVYRRKLHISGGIGTRHDIEGFDTDYNLPNDAYLETCAAIGFAFWAGEMHLLSPRAEYFEGFERALYNNILASVAEDARHYFYQNPLQSDGTIRRWEWHGCPCCPPMLLKLYSSLGTYIYTCSEHALCVNLLIGSTLDTERYSVTQEDGCFRVDSHGELLSLRIRIPAYADDPVLRLGEEPVSCTMEDGYAVITRVWKPDEVLSLSYTGSVRRMIADPRVADDRGKCAVFYGPYLLCAEGMDNGGNVDFQIAAEPSFTVSGEDNAETLTVSGKTADGKTFTLIPYYRWCRREGTDAERAMAVWFRQDGLPDGETLARMTDGSLYAEYPEMKTVFSL